MEVYSDVIEKTKEGKPAGPYSLSDLVNRLSPSISSTADDGTLFDITVARFRVLKERSLTLIQSHLKKEIFEELRQYTNLYCSLQDPLIQPSLVVPRNSRWRRFQSLYSHQFSRAAQSSAPSDISLHLSPENPLPSNLPPSLQTIFLGPPGLSLGMGRHSASFYSSRRHSLRSGYVCVLG